MTPNDQNRLACAAKAGNKRAVEALIKYCERDIAAIVAKTKCPSSEREDLAQVGRMTIIRDVIPNFNPAKGLQFRFYAAQWVRTYIQRYRCAGSSCVVRNVRTKAQADVSIDDTSSDGARSYFESTTSPEDTPEDAAIKQDRAAHLRRTLCGVIDRLTKGHRSRYDANLCREVVYGRLLSYNPTDLGILSTKYGVSRSTVQNIEKVIITKTTRALAFSQP